VVLVRRVRRARRGEKGRRTKRMDVEECREEREREMSHERDRDTSDYSLRLVSNSNRYDTSALHLWKLSILDSDQVVKCVIRILPFSINVTCPLSPEPDIISYSIP